MSSDVQVAETNRRGQYLIVNGLPPIHLEKETLGALPFIAYAGSNIQTL